MAKVLSIEVGLTTTRICETDYKSKTQKVYNYAKLPTPEGVIYDGEIKSMEPFATQIKSVLNENNIKTKQVIFTVASSRIASREITVPLVKDNQIDALVRANSSDYFPINLDEYELGYIQLGKVNDGGVDKHKLLALAAPKTIIASYKTLAGACGLSLLACDFCGNSIFQAVKADCGDEEVDMVVKIDDQSSIVTVIKNQHIALQRNLDFGISEGVETMLKEKVFGVSTYEEALALATRKTCIKTSLSGRQIETDEDDDEDESAQMLAAKNNVASSFETLIGSINRVMDFHSSRSGGETISNIYITGVGSDFAGLSKLLSNELGVKTKGLKNLSSVNLDKMFKDGPFGEYVTCVGAAMNPIGFMGADAKKGEKGKSKSSSGDNENTTLVLGIALGVICIGLTIFLAVSSKLELNSQQKLYDRNQQRITELQPAQVVYDEYMRSCVILSDVTALNDLTITHNDALLAFISELEKKMPKDIVISSFTSSLDSVVMNVDVSSKQELANVLQKLRSFDSISSVSISGATENVDDENISTVTFAVTCLYKTFDEMKAEEATSASK